MLNFVSVLVVCYFLTLNFQEKKKKSDKGTEPEKPKNSDKGTEPEKQKEKNIQEENSSGPKEEKSKAHKKSNPYGEWQEIKQEVEAQ